MPRLQPAAAALLTALGAASAAADTDPAQTSAAADGGNEAKLLSNTRQLIFEGRRSGEGYFSADGRYMVFQSEREPGNPFYQIYLLDLTTGDTTRISTGTGRTTCAWIHPDGQRVLFSSTHQDPQAEAKQQEELDKRAAGQGSRYSWSYDPTYEIYETGIDGGPPRRLTNARGYDAEGSWSPSGETILFASNRHAYGADADAATQAAVEEDPSRFMELYVMDADGGNVRRLTDKEGYDGGPFYSADGSRIVWRRFEPGGRTAEIWTMNADGSDQRAITDLGVMSWAPYFHPSGDYIIFTNNAHGYANFELYIVDAAGEHDPVRVTDTPGFDGLPVFTPDGDRLAWASSRTATKQAQIFMADWDDAAARALLGLPPAGAAAEPQTRKTVPMPALDPADAPALPATDAAVSAADLSAHVHALTGTAMAGRRTGTAGSRLATDYVARAMTAIGLAPAAAIAGEPAGSWLQPYSFTAGVTLEDGTRLALLGADGAEQPLALDRDWRPLPFSGTGAVAPAAVVFAGYGIVAPGDDGSQDFNSYGEQDVAGKWVLALRDLPADLPAERRQDLVEYADPRYKALMAREQGARGLILAPGPDTPVKDQLLPLAQEAGAGGGSLPVVSLSAAAAERLTAAAGADLRALQVRADAGEQAAVALDGVQLAADIRLRPTTGQDRNVVGRLQAGAAPSERVLVIGAHVDHIGDGQGLSSRDALQGRVHPGADDNASGVAAMLEIAEDLAARHRTGELDLAQDIVFAAWTGEELGRLGSAAFVEALAAAAGSSDGKVASTVSAYLNLDMVGRLDDHLYVQGVGSGDGWRRELERRNVPVGLPLRLQADAYLPTDTTSFYLAGVPVLSFFTGAHADYNTPEDTAEKLSYDGLTRIARLVGLMSTALAEGAEAPAYLAQEKPGTGASRANLRAYFGTIPAYADAEVAGVMLDGVAKGGPAEAGGLRAGDVITAVAGRSIENIYDYTYALNALKVGEPVLVQVRREGEAAELTVTPVARQ
ncbi:MAG: M20/M25/M40 family metallo-hydrolase [Gammaproteobacteria bacterium]|nr:M20/M25/M40 family metallo-hydrolase [Gammaproteobacteria bacterium]